MGDIAIDDISFNDGECPISNVCDFESADLCGYVNEINTNFLWQRQQGTSLDPDHTYDTETGHYLIANSTGLTDKTSIARLYSKSYPASTICVNFWYKIIGNSILNTRSYSFGKINSKAAFNASGDHGKTWSLGQATLSYTVSFQIVFEASQLITGDGISNGEVRIDDIEVNFKACNPIGTCDFEEGLCGFRNLNSADFEWVRLNGYFGLSQSYWDVPKFDHTTLTAEGSFMYLDTNFRSSGSKAWFESETISASSGFQCMQFWLKTNKNNSATLNINRRNKLTGEMVNLLSTNGNLQSEDWILKEAQLPQKDISDVNFPYSFVFEGIIGQIKGQLAFDDVKLYSGLCKGPVPPPGKFDCKNGQTIDNSLVCDFKKDCSNGADEESCGSCDFEDSNICGWISSNTASPFWNRTSFNTKLSTVPGPSIDHTLSTSSGILSF